MKQKELTKIFMMISNRKKMLWSQWFIHKYISAGPTLNQHWFNILSAGGGGGGGGIVPDESVILAMGDCDHLIHFSHPHIEALHHLYSAYGPDVHILKCLYLWDNLWKHYACYLLRIVCNLIILDFMEIHDYFGGRG